MTFNTVDEALTALSRGEMIIVVDNEDRENEGDLILAAEHATSAATAFMIKHTSGMLCVALPGKRLDALELPLMVEKNSESLKTAYTITVDLRHGTTTGISASDRAATIRALVDDSVGPTDFNRPGHVFPLRAVPGGVLQRPGHTEAAVDLTRLAGLKAGGVIAEIVKEDGSMARRPDLEIFAAEHGLKIITIEDIIKYRQNLNEAFKESEARIPTRYGTFRACVYKSPESENEHLAMIMGDISNGEEILVRVHSECLTGDTFGSLRCDCQQQLDAALAAVGKLGRGILLYLRGHEGRGIGLTHKLRAYALQDEGLDTVDANLKLGLAIDSRDYSAGAKILKDLGVKSLKLITNNPEKYNGISNFGLIITERIPSETCPTKENLSYLSTKKKKLGHTISLPS